MKKELIAGTSGKDRAYLDQLLLLKGYQVIGLTRQNDFKALYRLLYLGIGCQIKLTHFDLTKPKDNLSFLEEFQPYEVYNHASQSSVALLFKSPH